MRKSLKNFTESKKKEEEGEEIKKE